MTGHQIDEHELQAYVDGTLAPERIAALEAQLAANPEAARRVDAYRRQNQLLRAALDPLLDEPVPARLRVRPIRRLPAASLRYAGLAASLLLTFSLGWFARGGTAVPQPEFGPALAQRAVLAHLTFAPEVLHPVEVSAHQEKHLVSWLSKRLGTDVRAPHLQSVGFQLVGGRLLPGEKRPAAQFMYEDASGRRLTLYVATNAESRRETAFRFVKDGGVSTFYWIDGNVGYALSGTLERERLLKASETVYQELDG